MEVEAKVREFSFVLQAN